MNPQEIENLTAMMADDVREAFTEIDRLKAINADLIAACEAFAEYDNSATRAARVGVIDSRTLIVKYELANIQCRAALASATRGAA